MILIKFKKLLLTSLSLLMVIGLLSAKADVNAASYSSLSAADKKVFNSIVNDTSNVTSVTVSSPSISATGTSNIGGYRWTAWYNAKTKNFTIDKTKTNGTYTNGFPKTTTNASTSTNFSKTGWYKYLRDPIYKNIYLVAKQTFNWTTKDSYTESTGYIESVEKTDITSTISTKEGAYSSLQSIIQNNTIGLSNNKIMSSIKDDITINEIFDSGSDNARITGGGTTYISNSDNNKKITYKIIIKITSEKNDATTDTSTNHGKATINYHIYKKTVTTKYKNVSHSKTVEIARTRVASNASATEIAKYANFNLIYKGGGTSAKNTNITKLSNAGWWGANNPSYHTGAKTTSDSSGGNYYYYFSNSASGTNSVRLYNKLSKTEKLFTEQAKDTSVIDNPEYKYSLIINPNGGKYNGTTNKTTYEKQVNSTLNIGNPIRDGYKFINWEHSGEGTWNAVSKTYTFTGAGTLTAKWEKDDGTNSDDNNIKYTLTINPNGGKYNYSTRNTTITQKRGGTYTIQVPTRSGYIFDGWEVVSGNSKYLTESKYGYPSSYSFYGDATIKAKWIDKGADDNNNNDDDDANKASLVIDPNGGSWQGSTEKTTITKKVGSYLSIENPVRDNYVFCGWVINTNNDVNGVFNTSSHSYLFKRGTSTLTARWKKNTPTSCIIDGTGPDACPDSEERVINKFVHLTKNLD